ncbi:MAG: hypothetical protein ACTHL8_20560 [Burkholderiaceae bacterium]
MIKTAVVTSLRAKPSDRAYWMSRPMAERIAAVETLRRQHAGGNSDVEQGLQRVCRVARLHER